MKVFVNRTLVRLLACLVLGAVVAALVAVLLHKIVAGILIGWSVTALGFVLWTFAICWPMSGEDTQSHAMREDPTRGVGEVVCLVASVASIAGVAVLLGGAGSNDGREKVISAIVAVAAVTSSWLLVHTSYTLRYAAMYFDPDTDASIDFNEDDGYIPSYSDFYYVGFDMGTTYQISDTSVSGRSMRRHVTGQGMLGYVFGTVILASVINVVVSLVG